MLELRHAQLNLFEVRARHQAELVEETLEAGPCALAEAKRLSAPAVRRLLDQVASLVAAHAAGFRELVGQLIRPLGRQRDRTDGREPQPLEQVDERAARLGVVAAAAVSGGHEVAPAGAHAYARASTASGRSRRSRRRPPRPAPSPESRPARSRRPARPRAGPSRPTRSRRPPRFSRSSPSTPARAP